MSKSKLFWLATKNVTDYLADRPFTKSQKNSPTGFPTKCENSLGLADNYPSVRHVGRCQNVQPLDTDNHETDCALKPLDTDNHETDCALRLLDTGAHGLDCATIELLPASGDWEAPSSSVYTLTLFVPVSLFVLYSLLLFSGSTTEEQTHITS